MKPLILLGDLAPVDLADFEVQPESAPSLLTLANLEVPFCDRAMRPASKAGPCLRADPALLPAVARAFSPLVVSLANNHIMDFGGAGLEQTLAAAHAAGVRTLGAAGSHALATAPLRMEVDGRRIGVIAATDRWFGLAHDESAGTAPLDCDFIRRIRQLRPEVDLLIASVHGGGEVSPWPSPRWQQQLRLVAESGADIVHAHHPHVPLGWERWGNAWIFYGLGNSVVNPAHWPAPEWARRSWRVALNPDALWLDPQLSEWEVVPGGAGSAALRCRQAEVPAHAAEVADRNRPLGDPRLLEGLHQEYAIRLWESFYADRVNLADTGARRLRLGLRTLRDTALAIMFPERWRTRCRQRGLFHYHLFSSAGHADEIATALGTLHGELPDRRTAETRRLADAWLPRSLFVN
jgi:hypothetical protein